MKRFILFVFLISVSVLAVVAIPHGRTIVNRQSVPFVFSFVAMDELPLIGRQQDSAPNREDAVSILNARADALEVIAPGGMWRIPNEAGVIIGFFTGGPSAVSQRLVSRIVPQGTDVVSVAAGDITAGGTNSDGERRIETWELPDYGEPILIDGMEEDWTGSEILMRTGAMESPPRVENSRNGTELSIDDSRMWQVGGTSIQTVRSVLGPNGWYVALSTLQPISEGTFYHLRVFPDRDTASSAGQIVVPIKEKSGPIVYRDPPGRVTLVGQYVRRDTFVECVIARDTVESLVPDAFERNWSVDIASSRGDAEQREHFTFGTIYLNAIATGK